MAYRVFIDGHEGTTGLKIYERFALRDDVELLTIDSALRKDPEARRALLHAADVAFLCLPDAAARESVQLAEGADTILIDTSTAHRTDPDWAYGLPELSPAHRARLASAKRIAVPGCHATGFAAIAYPLTQMGLIHADARLTCHSITGYSGGGKKMIAEYEAQDRSPLLDSPRQYGLSLTHKHLPEMQAICGLAYPPVFNPIVCDFERGMAVSVPLSMADMAVPLTKAALLEKLTDFYAGQRFITVNDQPQDGFLPANLLAGTNDLHLYVCGNDAQVTLVSLLDNLGKGASGAAMQCMNIALGLKEDAFLA